MKNKIILNIFLNKMLKSLPYPLEDFRIHFWWILKQSYRKNVGETVFYRFNMIIEQYNNRVYSNRRNNVTTINNNYWYIKINASRKHGEQ